MTVICDFAISWLSSFVFILKERTSDTRFILQKTRQYDQEMTNSKQSHSTAHDIVSRLKISAVFKPFCE